MSNKNLKPKYHTLPDHNEFYFDNQRKQKLNDFYLEQERNNMKKALTFIAIFILCTHKVFAIGNFDTPTSDMFASIDAAVGTIEGQIRKNKTRLARRLRS